MSSVGTRNSLGNKRSEIGGGRDGKPDHIAALEKDIVRMLRGVVG